MVVGLVVGESEQVHRLEQSELRDAARIQEAQQLSLFCRIEMEPDCRLLPHRLDGTPPVRLLNWRESLLSEAPPITEGIEPTKLFLLSAISLVLVSSSKEVGIEPVRLFPDKSSVLTDDRNPSCDGSPPSNILLDSFR